MIWGVRHASVQKREKRQIQKEPFRNRENNFSLGKLAGFYASRAAHRPRRADLLLYNHVYKIPGRLTREEKIT